MRLTTQDTVLGEYNDPLSLHLYTYVESNPLTRVDPTGHAFACTQTCDTAEGGNIEPTPPQTERGKLQAIGMTEDGADHYLTTPGHNVDDLIHMDAESRALVVEGFNKEGPYVMSGQMARDEKVLKVEVGATVGVIAAPFVVAAAPVIYTAAATSPALVMGAMWVASNGEDTVNAVVNCSGGPTVECAASLAPLAIPGQQSSSSPGVKPAESAQDPISAPKMGTYSQLAGAKVKDAHHIVQHAAVQELPGYSKWDAPAIEAPGPSNVVGTPHYSATQAQNAATQGGTLGAEMKVAEDALKAAGYSPGAVNQAMANARRYFYDTLKHSPATVTRIPGNRKAIQ